MTEKAPAAAIHEAQIKGSVTRGLVSIEPWGAIEWVRVSFGLQPETYRVIFDNDGEFTVRVTDQEDLLDKITAAWRQRFPQSR
jgi:hypothetical protein